MMPLVFLLLCDDAHISATPLCVGFILLLTSVSKACLNNLSDKLRSGSQMNNLPLGGIDQALTLGLFSDFHSQDTTQMYLQIVGIYCHMQVQTIW